MDLQHIRDVVVIEPALGLHTGEERADRMDRFAVQEEVRHNTARGHLHCQVLRAGMTLMVVAVGGSLP